MTGTVTLSDAGTRNLTLRPPRKPTASPSPFPCHAGGRGNARRCSFHQFHERRRREQALYVERPAQELRIHHQRQQPAPGDGELGMGAAQHPKILLAARNVEALLRLEELLSARLLADAHATRRVLGMQPDV